MTPQKVFRNACLIFSFVGCVTVNVNFPEAAVQQATDDYVRELYQKKSKAGPDKGTPTSVAPSSGGVSVWVKTAFADTAVTFKTKTPGAIQIQERQSARISKVDEFKKANLICETGNGKLVVAPPEYLKTLGSLQQKQVEARLNSNRGDVSRLIVEENSDREALYDEIVKANGGGGGLKGLVVEKFTKSFQSLSPSGSCVQLPDSSWTQKP